MKRALFFLSTFAACAEDTSSLFIDVMDPAACARYCVDRLVIDTGDRAFTINCGDPIAVTELAVEQSITLQVRSEGPGIELRGVLEVRAEAGKHLTGPLELLPVARPHIEAITPDHGLIYGPSTILIEGTGFGSNDGGLVELDGVFLPILAWNERHIEATAEHGGRLTVEYCGIRSQAVDTAFHGVELEVLTAVDEDTCPEGQAIDASVGTTTGSPDVSMLFRCGAGACSHGWIASFDAQGTRRAWGPIGDCPSALSVMNKEDFFVALGSTTLARRRFGDEPAIAAFPGVPEVDLGASVSAVSAISAVGEGPSNNAVQLLVPRGQDGDHALMIWRSAVLAPFLDGELSSVAAVERRQVFGVDHLGRTVLVHWAAQNTITRRIDAGAECLRPRLLTTNRVAGESARRTIGVCEDRIVVFAPSENTAGPIRSFAIEGFRPEAIAVDRSGTVLLLVTDAAELVFYDLTTGTLLGRRPLPEVASPALRPVLMRTTDADVFYLGGFDRGRVLRVAW